MKQVDLIKVNAEISRELSEKTNEVARLREELIQAKQKAKKWKEKYRKLELSVRCEYCDPNGTIWECCTKRQYEQAAEIERLKSELARLAPAPEETVSKCKCLEKINGLMEIQGKQGTADYDEYMRGMYNGMEVIRASLIGCEGVFREIAHAPEEPVPDCIKSLAEDVLKLHKRDEPSPEWRQLGPDEETQDGVTMSEWYGGFSKIESTEPVIQDSRITEPEWRELGPDEVICEGDEVESTTQNTYIKVSPIYIGKTISYSCRSFRTRRPLPKQKWIPNPNYETATHVVDPKLPPQDEMPLDIELERLEDRDWSTDPIPDITTCIRYLRDEIQKLKQK